MIWLYFPHWNWNTCMLSKMLANMWPVMLLSRVRLFATPCQASLYCSLPGSSAHGIFQARVLEWIAISFFRGSSQPRDQTWVSCTPGICFTIWATREAQEKQKGKNKKKSAIISAFWGTYLWILFDLVYSSGITIMTIFLQWCHFTHIVLQ